LKYISRQIFEEMMGLEVYWMEYKDPLVDSPVIRYGADGNEGDRKSFNLYSAGLLDETTLLETDPACIKDEQGLRLFPSPDIGFDLSYDILSAAFFLITRMEEYGHDVHRYSHTKSIAFRNDFLRIPVIEVWVRELAELLIDKFPDLQIKNSVFTVLPTYDIDHAWAFKNKDKTRLLGGALHDLLRMNMTSLETRLDAVFLNQDDPFYTFPKILSMVKGKYTRSKFFFLMGPETKLSQTDKTMEKLREVILACNDSGEIGIHPSRRSNSSSKILKSEIDTLAELSGETITRSRQHFLEMKLPYTYQELIPQGIKEDYTMGYAEEVGFRAGTSRPFKWYDLANETETDLTIIPFCLMDQTLKQYLALSPDEALKLIDDLREIIHSVGGQFAFIWHNSSLSELHGWRPWIKVHNYLLEMLDKNY
jgi:hypothetical protein